MIAPSRALPAVVPAPAPAGATAPTHRARPPRSSRVLLINIHDLGEAGLSVLAVSWFSPTRNMVRASNPWLRGSLERGDIITHVNGRRVQGVRTLQEELDRPRTALTLTVVDCRTSASITWRVVPARLDAPGAPFLPGPRE